MLRFELPSNERKQDALEYIDEFVRNKSAINGTGGLDINDYDNWVKKTISSHEGNETRPKRVPASTYFVVNEENRIVGMVNIRQKLNDYLITSGSGHIGYSVRPSERRNGYATWILGEALQILKNDFNVSEALVGCYEDNIGSKRTIEKNGGVLDRKIPEENGKITLAYTIMLTEE